MQGFFCNLSCFVNFVNNLNNSLGCSRYTYITYLSRFCKFIMITWNAFSSLGKFLHRLRGQKLGVMLNNKLCQKPQITLLAKMFIHVWKFIPCHSGSFFCKMGFRLLSDNFEPKRSTLRSFQRARFVKE